MTGRRWPDPTEPGVPALALADSFHWLAWPETGAPTIGQWSPDLWLWVVTFWGEMVTPENMAHLDYMGIADPPCTVLSNGQETRFQTSRDALSAELFDHMTTKKPVTLAASPYAVFSMLDHRESPEKLNQRIEQFCRLISDPETADLWRRDLLILLHEQQRNQPNCSRDYLPDN